VPCKRAATRKREAPGSGEFLDSVAVANTKSQSTMGRDLQIGLETQRLKSNPSILTWTAACVVAPRAIAELFLAHVQLLRLSDLTVPGSFSEPYLCCMSIRRAPGSRSHPPTFAEGFTSPELSDPGPRKIAYRPIAHVARETDFAPFPAGSKS
jgi:hypothetical protein